VPVADLLQRHGPAWERATRHPFLAAVRAGTIPERAFDTWLVQDHRFVGDLLRFQARLLARAPRPAQAVLAAGAAALVAELEWFEEQAAARGLELAAPALPATEAYATLLERLDALDAGTALTALWALERVYLDAWSSAAPGAPAYAAFVEHWTTPEFGAYVEALEAAADAVPATADVDAVLDEVLEAERAFWDTALEQGAPR
jgi:formylaminopyrimidine deformylase / aminopyrimidine aminohydrolase